MIDDIVILAGGLGKRLGEVGSNVPKSMQKINGKPFIEYLLDYLLKFNFKRAIISVGYMADQIINHLNDNYKGLQIIYSSESFQLGTGGAIKHAKNFIKTDQFFLINGDSFANTDFISMKNCFMKYNTNVISSIYVRDVSRYGSLNVKNNKLIGFSEKSITGPGYINAGCYFLDKSIFNYFNDDVFSFENFISEHIEDINFVCNETKSKFIDIGIPSDLKNAQIFFKKNGLAK